MLLSSTLIACTISFFNNPFFNHTHLIVAQFSTGTRHFLFDLHPNRINFRFTHYNTQALTLQSSLHRIFIRFDIRCRIKADDAMFPCHSDKKRSKCNLIRHCRYTDSDFIFDLRLGSHSNLWLLSYIAQNERGRFFHFSKSLYGYHEFAAIESEINWTAFGWWSVY